jgi:hypothetical protein
LECPAWPERAFCAERERRVHRTAPGRRRQLRFGAIRDIYANDHVIAGFEFKDVGTAAKGNCAHTAVVTMDAHGNSLHKEVFDWSLVTSTAKKS